MSKQLLNTVSLKIFQDEGGNFGASHKDTYQNGFDAFWSGRTIFHDVFEHWFENKHEYFINKCAMNRSGECAAMGAALYYYNELAVHSRALNSRSIYTFEKMTQLENELAIKDSLMRSSDFGNKFESIIPNQDECNSALEYGVDDLWENVRNYQKTIEIDDEDKESTTIYRNSLTKAKVRNAYRWGYNMAENLIPNEAGNNIVMEDFITFFDDFCKNNEAECMLEAFSGLVINIYSEKNKFNETSISWDAELISQYGENMTLTEEFNLDDYLSDQFDLEMAYDNE